MNEIRPVYLLNETCQRTVPESIIAFLEAKTFEDAIRNAVSLGGDTNTLGAITGSIAEAYFGIPDSLIIECKARLDDKRMIDILDKIYVKPIPNHYIERFQKTIFSLFINL